MKPLILIDEAEADVSGAYGFYLPRRVGLADRFLSAGPVLESMNWRVFGLVRR